MQKIKRHISFCAAVIIIVSQIINTNYQQVFAGEESFTTEIDVQLQDEDGNISSQTGVNFISTSLEVTSNSLTVTMVYSGRELKFLNSNGDYTNDSTTNEDGNSVYTFAVKDISKTIACTVPAGGAASGVIYRYLAFIVSDDVINKIGEIYTPSDDEDTDPEDADDNEENDPSQYIVDGKIIDGKYTVKTISTGTDGVTEYLNAKHASPVTIEVEDGAVTAYVKSTDSGDYGDLSFNVEYTQISSENTYNEYKLTIEDINAAVTVVYGTNGRYAYLFTFDLDTLKAATEDNGTGNADDNDNVVIEGEPFEISVALQDEDGNETNGISGMTFGATTLYVTADTLTVTMVYSGRAINVKTSDGVYEDTSITNSDGNKMYTFALEDLDERIPVTVAAGGAAGGVIYRYLAFVIDDDTRDAVNEIYGQNNDNSFIVDDKIVDGKYTVETITTSSDGKTEYENSKHVSPVIIEAVDGVVSVYITSTVSVNSNESEYRYGGELNFDIEYELYSDESGYNQYKLDIDDIYSAITISYGPSDRYSYLITLDLDTLAIYREGDDENGGNEDIYKINATHTIQVEAQNEDGSTNTINADLNPIAQLEIDGDSIVAYVSASLREWKFLDVEGNYTNDVVSYVDGIRTYRIVLSNLEDRVQAQFPAGGAATGAVTFYLAFFSDTLTPINADTEFPFRDVDVGAWYYNAIKYVYDNDIMVGMSDTEFEPETTISRAMVITTIWRIQGEPSANVESPFSDLTQEWYEEAIAWAAENKIVEGYGDGLFGPEDDITREQMATMLYRYTVFTGEDGLAKNSLEGYTDTNLISAYALESMQWANATGLIIGRTATELEPTETATRAELATVLNRYLSD